MATPLFHVTLNNLSRDGRTAVEGEGMIELGPMAVNELTDLLAVFVEIDPVQNLTADPEVRVQTKRDRFIIRTGQRKLFLQDARNLSEPAYVLTAGEIIAELDGSAAAKRTVPPMPRAEPVAVPAYAGDTIASELAPRPEPVERPRPWALIALVLLLAGYIGYAEWAGHTAAGPAGLVPLTTAERVAEDASLAGVYTTGSEPGQHGIILLGDGKLKLFRVYAQAAPGVVYGTYRLGRVDGKLVLATDQPGGLIAVRDRTTLEFCGERYQRVP